MLASLARLLHTYLSASRSPVDLAVTRIVVFALLAVLCVRQSPVWMAALPKELLHPPPGTEWLTALPIEPAPTRIGLVVTLIAALMAMLGVGYRVTAPLAVIGALYVLGIPQLWGKVNHYHHVVWFAAILALSPAVDALAWKRGIPESSPTYGKPLALMGLLIGLCYFMPGMAKLGTPGWISADNLKYQLYQKWTEIPGFTPPFPLDQYPLALRLLALSVVLFELSFIWLILFPRLLPLALTGGVAFHVGSGLFMGINFWTLWLCYVVFVPWGLSVKPTLIAPPQRRSPVLLGWGFVAAAILAYPLRLDSWPITHYPTFAYIAGPIRQLVVVEGLSTDVERRISERMHSARWHAVLARAAEHPNPGVRERTALGIVNLVRREDPTQRTVRLWTIVRSVVPH